MSESIEPLTKITLKIVSAIFALLSWATSYFGLQEVALFGFPDGHVTAYERAVAPALNLLLILNIAFGIYFLALTIGGISKGKMMLWFTIATSSFVFLLLIAKIVIPWYFGSYLALENGTGG